MQGKRTGKKEKRFEWDLAAGKGGERLDLVVYLHNREELLVSKKKGGDATKKKPLKAITLRGGRERRIAG